MLIFIFLYIYYLGLKNLIGIDSGGGVSLIVPKTRRGSPVDHRPSTDEAPPIGKTRPFSKMAVTFEPLMRF